MEKILQSEISYSLLNTAIATVILLLTFGLFRIFFPWLIRQVERLHGTRIRSLKFHNFEIISSHSITSGLCGVLKVLHLFGTLFLLYFYLTLVLSFFPETQELSQNMIHYILDPLKEVGSTFLAYIPKAIYICVIFLVIRYVLKVIRMFFDRIEKGFLKIEGFHSDWARPTYNLVRILVFAFTLIIIFPHLPGSSSPAFQGISVFLGLLISLGSGSAVSNLVSGIVITYMRPFQVGDRVKVGETIGDVLEKNLLVTRVRTIKNIEVTIPNSMVLNSHVMNYSAEAEEKGLILNPRLSLGYEVDWRQIHSLLLKAADRTEGVLKDPKPFIFQTALNSYTVEYELNAYTRLANEFDNVYSDLFQNIHDIFNEAQVEIMSPAIVALRDGNQTKFF